LYISRSTCCSALAVITSVGLGFDVAAQTRVLKHHEDNVYSFSFAADGRSMASASGDNTAVIWDLPKEQARYTLPHGGPVYSAAFSPDGQRLATGSGDGRVSLWAARNGKEIQREKKHGDAVYCLAFSPDGKRLATAGGNGDGGDTVCRLWDTSNLHFLRHVLYSRHCNASPFARAPCFIHLGTNSKQQAVRRRHQRTSLRRITLAP